MKFHCVLNKSFSEAFYFQILDYFEGWTSNIPNICQETEAKILKEKILKCKNQS